LSIARAVLSDAPILLLDEATSALDAQTEQTVLGRLRQLEGKTCIAVTHRPAAVELCRWQLQLQNGKCEAKVRQED
jgi:ATP-binding cassette subfamily B protein